jgi:tetratricopeptide (TPR) repeat protein
MSRNGIINGIFALLLALAFSTAFHVSAQKSQQQPPKEPYLEAARRAGEAMRRGDFSAAVELYTEAVNLFPKIDAYTPKSKKLELTGGGFVEAPYTGLDGLYASRARAYLLRRNFAEAGNDYANALTVLKYEITKNIEKAKNLRRTADIKKERENAHSTIYNSNLARAAFDFSVALQACDRARHLNQSRIRFYAESGMPLAPEERNIRGFDQIVKYKEEALFGKAEAEATLMIEVENREYAFPALKSSEELIAAFPGSVEGYRLRARVYRRWGREAEALADEQRAGELSAQK